MTRRLAAVYLFISLAFRVYLLCIAPELQGAGPGIMAAGLLVGLFFDLVVLADIAFLYRLSLWGARGNPWLARLSWFSFVLFFLCFAIAEGLFWNEFKSRFNFIAVDYLLYTREVRDNILESFNCGLGLVAAMVLAALATWLLCRNVKANRVTWRSLAAHGVLIMAMHLAVSEKLFFKHEATPFSEIAKNGVHTLFYANRMNFIEYGRYYRTKANASAGGALSRPAETKHEVPAHSSIALRRPHVILVLMESMSARFMDHYTPGAGLTPNLDRAADEGIWFSNVYATGTRTVRGIEAVALSIPPTPGQSLVRRPISQIHHDLGDVLSEHSYVKRFTYGGYSFFDNMGPFFRKQGYAVDDRSTVPEDEVHFTNAWGVCDEDMFAHLLSKMDKDIKRDPLPRFEFVLTVSNHRPYTYPAGRIDIPSGKSREGAVKYSDYAVGRLMKDLESRPWGQHTLVIFVADHNASVAGGTAILKEDYLIPMIFWRPGRIIGKRIDRLGSQIDLAKTLLSYLGIQDQLFTGHSNDLFDPKSPERAFLATYQRVALLTKEFLSVLQPVKGAAVYRSDGRHLLWHSTGDVDLPTANAERNIVNETIETYQGAYDAAFKYMEGNSGGT